MDALNIALAMFFFMVTYILFKNCIDSPNANHIEGYRSLERLELDPNESGSTDPDERLPMTKGVGSSLDKSDGQTTKEVIYSSSYYPWWRSTRWWNYDGWLYQKPYYNYWRRPQFYNYYYSGKPLVIGGKRYYKRDYQ